MATATANNSYRNADGNNNNSNGNSTVGIDHYDKTVTTATKMATTETTYGKISCSTCTVEWSYICTRGRVKTGAAPKTYFLFGKKVV